MLYAGSNLDKARRSFERTSKHRPRTLFLSDLAKAYADLGQFDDAWRCYHEATTTIEISMARMT